MENKPNRKPGHRVTILEANPPTTSQPLGCIKVEYQSVGDANKAAKLTPRVKLYPYRCTLCQKWHLTRTPQ